MTGQLWFAGLLFSSPRPSARLRAMDVGSQGDYDSDTTMTPERILSNTVINQVINKHRAPTTVPGTVKWAKPLGSLPPWREIKKKKKKYSCSPFVTALQFQKYLHSLQTGRGGQLLLRLNSCGSPKAPELTFQFPLKKHVETRCSPLSILKQDINTQLKNTLS